MPISDLLISDTFRTWFNKTNEIISRLNTGVVADNTVSYGVFAIGQASNTSFNIANNLIINSTSIVMKATTTISSNVTVNSSANVVNLSPNSLILQPTLGTIVNSAISVNGTASFLGNITANANVTIVNALTAITGNVTATGTTTANGALITRQVLFLAANAVASPSALNNPQYDDFSPTGLAECNILNVTPAIDTVFTGLAAPSISSGGRVLYIQNLSTSKKITFAAANTSSTAANRFGTPGNVDVELLPGASLTLIWNYDTSRWRIASPLTTAFSSLAVTGNGSISGTLTAGILSVSSGGFFGGNLTVTGFTNALSTLQVAGNTLMTNLTVSSVTTLSGNVTTAANASLASATLVLAAPSQTATFGNVFNANSSSQSFVRNLKANTFLSDGTATCSNVVVTNILNASGGRMVLPVGTNLWA